MSDRSRGGQFAARGVAADGLGELRGCFAPGPSREDTLKLSWSYKVKKV